MLLCKLGAGEAAGGGPAEGGAEPGAGGEPPPQLFGEHAPADLHATSHVTITVSQSIDCVTSTISIITIINYFNITYFHFLFLLLNTEYYE